MLQRFKSAAFGFGITLVPIAVLACVQFLLAPYTIAVIVGMDPETNARAVSSLRHGLVGGYSVIALIIAAHWLLVATLGRGAFLRIKSANIALALSVLTFAFLVVIASTASRPDKFLKGACPLLGLPDELPLSGVDGAFSLDGQSSCDAFAQGAAPIVLLGLPLIFLTASAILRVVVSRRR